MRKLMMLGVVAALAFPVASHAQFGFGFRLGFGLPMGDVATDAPLKDLTKGQIPLQVDGMYKFSPDFSAGLYLSYGFGMLSSDFSDACDFAGIDCSVSNLRLGVQGIYSFSKASPQFVPWLGAGLGLEWLTLSGSAGGSSDSASFFGIEFLNLQVGGDYKVSPTFSVGPYAMFALGRYSSFDGDDIPEKAMHQWLSFGVRGAFDL